MLRTKTEITVQVDFLFNDTYPLQIYFMADNVSKP